MIITPRTFVVQYLFFPRAFVVSSCCITDHGIDERDGRPVIIVDLVTELTTHDLPLLPAPVGIVTDSVPFPVIPHLDHTFVTRETAHEANLLVFP